MNFATAALLTSVLSTTAFLGGCMAAAMAPSSAQVANAGRVVVVPLEPPPLGLPPGVGQSIGPDIIRAAVPLTTAPTSQVQAGGTVLALVGGVITLLDLATAATPTTEPARLEDVLGQPGTWLPTVVLAEEAAAQLSVGAAFHAVTTAAKYRRLPVGNRGATWHMANWYRPIKAWYADDAPGIDYRQDIGTDAVVLEVGLMNYEWIWDYFVVRVMMKVVDPGTGRVIGRAQHWKSVKAGPIRDFLAKDGARLKEVFIETARPLVATALRELGLVPR